MPTRSDYVLYTGNATVADLGQAEDTGGYHLDELKDQIQALPSRGHGLSHHQAHREWNAW